MAFTELEIAQHMKVLEDSLWTLRRPALHLRDRIREGQRFTDQSLATGTFFGSKKVGPLCWERADGQWHGYPPGPAAKSPVVALAVIPEDANGCFVG